MGVDRIFSRVYAKQVKSPKLNKLKNIKKPQSYTRTPQTISYPTLNTEAPYVDLKLIANLGNNLLRKIFGSKK